MPSVLTAAQIREAFLRFFEERGHRRIASSPLVPQNDPTLLFTNAGMVQFKDVFTGREKRDYSRATSSQKCVRAGGKHNDLDNVGFTARHHTFFEMLGNFSFGDYFKADAIAYAWEFVTKTLGLDVSRLAVTVFNGEKGLPWDEEAYALWAKTGVARERIYKLGYKDNFWAMGDTGPCGPCSEIHYFQGNDVPCAEEAAGRACEGVACDCDRWLEIWNLVFMQFERKEKDAPLVPLPKPSIDTGAGLERMASVVQGKRSNYDTDLFQAILARVAELAGRPYRPEEELSASMRVIADHSRAAAFLISDGVQPSNEGRGYVLRRIMRRAVRHGAKLGLHEVFFPKTVDRVIEVMGEAFPELKENRAFVLEVCRHEEESFRRTLDRGLRMIDEETARLKQSGEKMLSGEAVFFLHDTHGFPWDLTQIIARERGFDIDQAGYEARMAKQRDQGEFAGSGDKAVGAAYAQLLERLGATDFLGYETRGHEGEGTIKALLKDGVEVNEVKAGDTAELLLDRTPFYGESGGQVGDTGRIVGNGGKSVAQVQDTQKPVSGLVVHKVQVTEGAFRVNEMVQAGVDAMRRTSIRANHSATHLLHRALKIVLGEHVKQAGSVVAPDYLRFDYTHFAAPSPEQLEKVEDLVNDWVRENTEAQTKLMKLDEAKKSGAVAMFGEKYGETVRVVTVHPESTELCGGTHVKRSGDIGLFKIVSESGIASGVRRITAVTGVGALAYLRETEREMRHAAELLKASPRELVKRVEATLKRTKELEKKVEEVQLKAQAASSKDLLSQARDVNGMKVLATRVDPADADVFRGLADQLRDRLQSGVVAIGGEKDGKALILVAATKDVVARGIKAGDLVREMAKEVGGKGGGKPDMAQAGGADPSRIAAALDKLYELVQGAKPSA
ncbi:alanine--tRNA ligase [Aggregicoccus sp. 17bor-14]|uniref:alanine--tRNA ligase n=1 Tax=Myxococcaceae TaxID=31 RepID=UPI00129C56D5|nr:MULTISPECIES: alanine--tRNA ligase [Myxococcaceae]MBF5044718.1 alanine--tRNA ligase [Simulacricoccus sp. 17bor-14]MRI90462.1 alanine--tRNA ligase [Aggregicoccus sp. 17bor-14]